MPDVPDYAALVREIAAHQAKSSSSVWWCDGDDRLRLRTFGSLAGVVLTIEGRRLTPAGDVAAFVDVHTPNSDRTVATTLHPLGAGFLLNVQLRASTGTPRVGQVYAILELVRGTGATVQSLGVLGAGYVTDTSRLGWPGSPVRASIDGPGVIRSIAGTNPAANTEFSETVPTNARWRLLSAMATLVTDGTAANRDVALTIDDGTTVYHRAPAAQNHVASLTTLYVWAPHAARVTIAQDRTIPIPIPDLHLMGGHRLVSVTTNLQATDNWGAPQLLVEEWIED